MLRAGLALGCLFFGLACIFGGILSRGRYEIAGLVVGWTFIGVAVWLVLR